MTVGKLFTRDVDTAQIGWELGRRIVESLHDNSTFDLLTNFVIFAASVFYMLAVVALIVLRIRHPEWNRPYRTWGYPYVPSCFWRPTLGFWCKCIAAARWSRGPGSA